MNPEIHFKKNRQRLKFTKKIYSTEKFTPIRAPGVKLHVMMMV